MKLCIAEKPSVAKEIAEILGAKSRKDGYFEGNGYCVSWTFGHLCTLKEPNDYTEKWKSWNLENLPMIPSKFGIKLINDGGVKKQFKVIERLVHSCDEVINCGDAGQEGELIQRWVLAKAGNRKPLKRLWISSLTEEAIKDGFSKLRNGNDFDRLYAAGSSRAIGDWMLGMNATRLYTLKYGRNRQVLSIGRVQTPTLAMIVQRQNEIEAFVPEDFYEIATVYRDTIFACTKGRFKQEDKAQAVIDTIKDAPFTVISFETKEGKELPPQLYDLTSLQVECNKLFGFSADETLKYTQSLYEKKLVTYPRVDTRYLSNDIYPKVKGILSKLSYYQSLCSPLLSKKIRNSKKVFDDKKVTDHHAIIPTGAGGGATGPEQKVYDTITRRFIAVFYPDCTISNTTVMGDAAGIEFKATGKQILDPGWRVVYGYNPDDLGNQDVMPNFVEGESGPHEPELQKKKTSPPKYYTEATLLRAMETAGKQVDDDDLRELMKDNGIGRPSTRANIIETLFRRKYIAKQKKRIVATDTGKQLIGLIHNDLLKSPELTGQWERKLRDIERGDYSVQAFKKELMDMVNRLVHEVKFDIHLYQNRVRLSDFSCPKCKEGKILTGKSAYGCSNYKNGCDFVIPYTIKGVKIQPKHMKQLLESGKTDTMSELQGKSFVLSEGFGLEIG